MRDFRDVKQQRHSRTASAASQGEFTGFCTNCGLKEPGCSCIQQSHYISVIFFFFPHTALHIVGQEVNVFQNTFPLRISNYGTMRPFFYPPDFFLRRKRDLGFPILKGGFRVIEDLVDFTASFIHWQIQTYPSEWCLFISQVTEIK